MQLSHGEELRTVQGVATGRLQGRLSVRANNRRADRTDSEAARVLEHQSLRYGYGGRVDEACSRTMTSAADTDMTILCVGLGGKSYSLHGLLVRYGHIRNLTQALGCRVLVPTLQPQEHSLSDNDCDTRHTKARIACCFRNELASTKEVRKT